ncbi:uncharacterized protein CBL_02362 [Carabus blaptoides fortunei]
MDKTATKVSQEKNMVVGKTDKNCASEISIKQFLDFLRTAYQVSESVEETLSSVEGTAEAVDWIKLKNTELVKPKTTHSVANHCVKNEESECTIRVKLDEVLNEGLLDSVLPYLVPPNAPKKTSSTKISEKGNNSVSKSSSSSKENLARRKSSETGSTNKTVTKTDSEVEIHVCDEVKNVKKDFICSQKLLVEKMGYFAEVTSGQKLEDMDISVHCDISIFEWLMRWVKKELIPEEDWPKLDAQCVIPILVSAAFLQMEPLLQDCLFYCHENMNEILQSTTNLNCLNDSIITRLAAMYTNSELETIKDKRDKIQSRLYCKMIISLCEQVCESVRGHWNSLARIYRCVKCEQLIMLEVAQILPCHPSCMSLDRSGDIVSHHVRDPNWNINEYILSLQSRLKAWRKVYWHLWGDCHYLYCTVCEKPFPAHKFKWCCYHPEPPQFFTVDSQKAPLPVGRYPCCGERAYRFQILKNYSGCQFREHVPQTDKARDAAVTAILNTFRDVVATEPPELIFPERLTRLVARDSQAPDGRLACKEVFWWDGIRIVPPRQNQGVLGSFGSVPIAKELPYNVDIADMSSEDESSSDSSSSDTDHSEESRHSSPKRVATRKINRKKSVGRLWQMNLSARSNQDLQRSNEENLLSKMVSYLSRNSPVDSAVRHKGWMRHVTPPGGIYARLEAEWKEAHCPGTTKKSYNTNKSKYRTNR